MRCSSVPGDDPDVVAGLGARIGLLDARSASGTSSGMCWIRRAAERDVQQLLAAADAEHRHVAVERAAGDGELEGGAAVLGGDRRMAGRRAEQRRIDIEGAAGDDQPVDQVEIVRRARSGSCGSRIGSPPAAAHRVAIILAQRIPGIVFE